MAERPNVVMIVLDDVGFSDFGCFGSTISTPSFDRLAATGLRYTGFHATPLCAPSRACYLTGRDHHAVDTGGLPFRDQDGHRGAIPPSAGLVARVLQDDGYRTIAVGKWHNTPDAEYDAPTDHWPTRMGFDSFYGFIGAAVDQYEPPLTRDERHVDPPTTPEEGYHLTEDLADEAIRQLDRATDQPFFLYFATGAAHSPHQVHRAWIDAYRGRFDDGYEVERERRYRRQLELGIIPEGTELTERPPIVPSWEDDLSDAERIVYARQMETFAGFLTHTDAQIGRILDHLERAGRLDDTLVLLVSDNGADGNTTNGSLHIADVYSPASAAEAVVDRLDEFGTPGTFNMYATGWAWAGSTPLRMWKFYTWLGGVRVPLIVRWPAGIAAAEEGTVRAQFAHAIDVMPTILEVTGTPVPDEIDGIRQQPLDGASFRATFHDAAAPAARTSQYFEMNGSRSMYHEGWKATTDHVPLRNLPVGDDRGRVAYGSLDYATDRWSLYDLAADFSEARDVAHLHPERVSQLVGLWESEADRLGIHPMDDTGGMPPPHLE